MTRQTVILWSLLFIGIVLIGWMLVSAGVFSGGRQP